MSASRVESLLASFKFSLALLAIKKRCMRSRYTCEAAACAEALLWRLSRYPAKRPDGTLPRAVMIAARLLVSPDNQKIKNKVATAIRTNTPTNPTMAHVKLRRDCRSTLL